MTYTPQPLEDWAEIIARKDAEIERLRAAMQWRPMWCIPQATPVLVLLKNGECLVTQGPFAEASKAEKVAVYKTGGPFPNVGYTPVGWMHIPPPPAGETSE